jgi:nitrogenase molybdenum-cofactor synthesis protein NifE
MEKEFGIPYIKVSFFGKDDTTTALLRTAEALKDEKAVKRAKAFTTAEESALAPFNAEYRPYFEGRRAAIYVGGGFKAISLVRQFNSMGIDSVVVGTQTGQAEDYAILSNLVGSGAVILDDANPAELETFIKEKKADILVGGVKERPLAYKLGIAFCDHNHERKHPLAGYIGVRNFTKEIHKSMNSPVWKFLERAT